MSPADRLDALMTSVPPIDLTRPLRVHIVGIGGTGMRAIARVLASMGHTVTGSDQRDSAHLDGLRRLGIAVAVGHDESLVLAADLITRSTAVPDHDADVRAATQAGIPVESRATVLAALSVVQPSVLIAGTHGKTTTSSMLAVILDEARRRPSFIIGSDVARFRTGARWSEGTPMVIEADESDGTFLALTGQHAVVTSLDPDHLDFYGDREVLAEAFKRFVLGVVGPVALCVDDPDAAALMALDGVVTYGTVSGAHHRLTEIEVSRHHTTFMLSAGAERLGSFRVGLPGRHNALNAAGAAAIALAMGVAVDDVRRGLASFSGVARRFEERGRSSGVTFIDDYAHLPAEVEAAIAAAREGEWRRVVAVYQPHRFSRTERLGATFADSFSGADHVVLTGIYPSGETPRAGVSGRIVFDAATARNPTASITYAETLDGVVDHLLHELRPEDLCLTLGAGDLTTVPDRVRAALDERRVGNWEASLRSSEVSRNAPLGSRTTYRVGGTARLLVEVGSRADLQALLRDVAAVGDDLMVISRGSNLLVADAGFDGVAINLLGAFADVAITGTTVTAGAAVALPALARQTVAAGLTGFEWAVGIPGSVGGAVVMNAGGHGADMAASVVEAQIADLSTGAITTRGVADLQFGYRHSSVRSNEVVVGVRLELARGDREVGDRRLRDIVTWRRENQPGGQNAGSVFTNPVGDSAGRLIDVAGGKGRRVGSAAVSTKHANFIQVDPGGSADDVYTLMCEVAQLVFDETGVTLTPETRMVGLPAWRPPRSSDPSGVTSTTPSTSIKPPADDATTGHPRGDTA